MKKNYLFISFLFILFGCGSNSSLFVKDESVKCPPILFSSEHMTYLGSGSKSLNLDNISYKIEINNSIFKDGCKIKDNLFSSILSILFIAKPLELDQDTVTFPYFIAIIDEDKQVYDIQYYSMNSTFFRDTETDEIMESDLFKDVLVEFPSNTLPFSIVIGFMLDEKQLQVIN